ncbi:deoxyribonuclease V [Paenibacillus sp. FJAT-26967]|uniref:deoxyribonuclease V n=1 Tax=Paenibacillus sp. FJAT-26967 TaxID=1729690 RepID=UPI000838D63E|nr:deoxyribonuclease V [Paenibacillus sp. FJAT-26967]
MKPVIQHSWNLTETEATALQKQLALQVTLHDQLNPIHYIAGVDVAYSELSNKLIAAVVILEAVSLHVIETVVMEDMTQFSYIPGLFSFRELPPVVQAFEKLGSLPELVVCDAQGIAHPRRFGLASHLGVLFDIPAIGCGKTRLIGEYSEPGLTRGSYSPLQAGEQIVGAALRTQDNVKPIYVSIGHRISLPTAQEWILNLCPQYRLPETTRQADQLVRRALAQI